MPQYNLWYLFIIFVKFRIDIYNTTNLYYIYKYINRSTVIQLAEVEITTWEYDFYSRPPGRINSAWGAFVL